jgi:outer membrane receptor protein involved in Fe transport
MALTIVWIGLIIRRLRLIPDITSVAYTENVGNAEIDGMEINAIYALNDSTKVNFYLNKMDPKLSNDYYYVSGELGANAGNRLASMPELSYYLSLDKDLVFMGKPAFISFRLLIHRRSLYLI